MLMRFQPVGAYSHFHFHGYVQHYGILHQLHYVFFHHLHFIFVKIKH